MSWYFFHIEKLDFQSNKDSCEFTFGYLYILSVFFVISIATKEAFWLMVSSLGYIV